MHIDHIFTGITNGDFPLIPDAWGQGRTIYGGMTAAILLQAMLSEVEHDRKLRAMDVNFTRPFEADVPYTIQVETLGEGRTVCVKSARLIQGDKVRAVVRADFCRPLDNSVRIDQFTVPDIRAREQSFRITGMHVPVFFQNVEVYMASHVPPFGGKPYPEMHGYMRFAQAPAKITTPHLVGLIDAWPPTASTHYAKPVPISTISWHIHFTLDADNFAPDEFLGYESKVSFDEAGVSSTTAHIWRPDGRLLAKSVQTNVIYG